MAINFPDSPSNGDTTTLAGKTYTYDSSKSKWSPSGAVTLSALSVGAEGTASGDGAIAYNGAGVFSFTPAVAAGTGVTVHANQTAMIAASADEGSLHYENANNRLYVKAASGFYLLATISNVTPTITDLTHTTDGTTASVAAGATFGLTSGQNTVITLTSSDPDVGQSLTHSATLTAGTLSNVASGFTQGSGADVNKFTLVPVTSGSGGTVTYRFDVTDGVGTAQRTASFSIAFTIANSRYTSLLMAANAAGNNSTFTDSNTQVAAKTITPSGNPTQGSFTPFRRASYSIHMDGTDALSFANNPDFQFGTDLFTIEGFYKFDSLPSGGGSNTPNSGPALFSKYGSGGLSYQFVFQNGIPNFNLNASIGGSTVNITFTLSSSLSAQTWYHICLVRTASDTYKLFLDGTQVGGTQTQAGSINAGTGTFEIGRVEVGGTNYNNLIGSVHSFRVIKGAAVIPPSGGPTEPLTAVTNTKLLVAANHPFMSDVNSQVTAKTLTQVGDPVVRSSGPYNYESVNADDGGSIEFDSSGDYLSTSTSSDFSFGTGDFTVECWFTKDTLSHKGIWQISTASSGLQSSNYGNTLALGYQSGVMQIYGGGNSTTASAPITANNWFHAAYVRSSGVSKLYINGTETISQSDTNNYALTNMVIGGYYTTGYLHNGKISNLRVVKGTAVYTSNFTPPTSQLTAITNTKLLLLGQGAKIFDKSQTQNFALSGATGNATNKGGNWANTFSTRLASTSNYVNFYDKPIIGKMDFTIEAFLKWDSTTGYNTALYSHYYTNSNRGVLMYNNTIYLASASSASSWGAQLNLGTPPSANTWYHLAAVRNGANLFGFINGTRTATLNIGATFDVNDPDNASATQDNFGRIGAGRVLATTPLGYISDFRITHGLARYTAADETGNIPTAPLKG